MRIPEIDLTFMVKLSIFLLQTRQETFVDKIQKQKDAENVLG